MPQLIPFVEQIQGFHVWIFSHQKGLNAAKASLVAKVILEEIGHPNLE